MDQFPWHTPTSGQTRRSPTFFSQSGATHEHQAITSLTNALNRLDKLEADARAREREAQTEAHKASLVEQVGQKACELSVLRESLADLQHRKVRH